MESRLKNSPVDPINSDDSLIPWEDLLDTLFYHRRMITIICAIGVTLSLAWAWATPPRYRAQAMIMVKANRTQMSLSPEANARPLAGADGVEQINSLATLITSPVLIAEVLSAENRGNTESDQGFVVWLQDSINSLRWQIQGIPGTLYRWAHGLPPPTDLEQRVAKILSDLEFTPVPDSNLVVVAYKSRSAWYATKLVNSLVDNLISKYTKIHEHTGAQRFYEDQRNLLADRLADAQSKLTEFRESVGSDLLSVNLDEIQQRIAELDTELLATRTRRAELESLANAPEEAIVAEAGSQDTEAGTVTNPAIFALKERVVTLEIQRSELLSRYTKSSVAVKDLDRQIADAKELLEKERKNSVSIHRRTAQAKLDLVDAKIASITGQLDNYRDTLSKLEDVLPQLSRLQNNVRSQQEAYVTYLRKEEEARLSSALDDSHIVNIAIAERAQVPTSPAQAGMKRRFAFGVLLSMILGVGFALFRDFTDPSIKTAGQAERIAGLPVLGRIQG